MPGDLGPYLPSTVVASIVRKVRGALFVHILALQADMKKHGPLLGRGRERVL